MEPLKKKIIQELSVDSAESTVPDPCIITCRFPFPNQKSTYSFDIGADSVWVYHHLW